jgi:hypothetical protein
LGDDEGISLRNTFDTPTDTENSLMNTRNDLGDTGFDASLLPEIRDVLSSLTDYDASIFGGNEGT